MREIIYSCGCGDTDKFAADAYRILKLGDKTPQILHTRGQIEGVEIGVLDKALKLADEKYAYYVRFDDNHTEIWDLLKGVRVL